LADTRWSNRGWVHRALEMPEDLPDHLALREWAKSPILVWLSSRALSPAVAIVPPTCCLQRQALGSYGLQRCHAPFSGDDPTPFRHQVMEMPPIQPVVTAYQWHQLVCPACGETTRAPWPAGVPRGTYGPRVHATVALYTGAYRLSKRRTGQVMDDVCAVPMRVGTISQSEKATTQV